LAVVDVYVSNKTPRAPSLVERGKLYKIHLLGIHIYVARNYGEFFKSGITEASSRLIVFEQESYATLSRETQTAKQDARIAVHYSAGFIRPRRYVLDAKSFRDFAPRCPKNTSNLTCANLIPIPLYEIHSFLLSHLASYTKRLRVIGAVEPE
jgi:hypothetical protein